MTTRGIRGATTIIEDNPQSVLAATRELMLAIIECNPSLQPEDVASILFTVTGDIRSTFPAKAARELGEGWQDVPLMDACEIDVEDGLKLCIRVLLHWNTDLLQREIHHVYLNKAVLLRPDIVGRRG